MKDKMVFIAEKLRALVATAIKKNFTKTPFEAIIEYPAIPQHGDYATSCALPLAKILQKEPREVAEAIISAIKKPAWISKIEIAGHGFINFFLAPAFLTEFLAEVVKEGAHFGHSERHKGETVVTDTSHPNVAKPMGVHHLLSTIIGNSLNRIFAAVGYTVVRDNYLGDWGTQFGKLIYAYKTWGDPKAVEKDPIPELLKLYVKFHDEAERDASLEDKGRAEFKKLEDGDSENRRLWKWVVDLSMKEFNRIWRRLDVTFDVIHGESFYEDKMQEIIDMGTQQGLFVKGERGALIAPFPNEKYPPCIIKKSDGATTYATRDLARVKYWEDTWHPELMIMMTDTAQSLHFQQFIEVAEMLNLTDARNLHVPFGRMRFPEKRMSTRKGGTIFLEALLDEAEERAYGVASEKNPDLGEKEKKEVARKVGIGAVKYAVLAQNRMTDITFTWDKMLSLEGNSAPYVQYVYARAKSILRKAKKSELNVALSLSKGFRHILKEPQEVALARLLPKFPEVVAKAAEEFKPNLIANFLYELASAFNTFYQAVPVLTAGKGAREMRLALVEAATITLKNGLKFLGIETPEEM